ncbi:flagellar export protein FliJ [Paucibacter sp. JuS9]|uniref:flagellar export protein FliJ n=1 Tax=Roseateles TaxID=93681 RepID=UPI002FE517FD
MSASQNLSALLILLERAEVERDEALQALQQARARADAARMQANQLTDYRQEYQQRWTQQFAQRTTVDILGCYQTFGNRLDQAITSQGNVASHAETHLATAQALVRERELRVASVRKLIERRRLEQMRGLLRQEQKATDEQAARAALTAYGPAMRLSA